MFDKYSLIKLLLSFIIGGKYIYFSVWLAEKLGSIVDGIMISMPTTALVGLLFIGLTQNELIAARVSTIILATVGIATLISYFITLILLIIYSHLIKLFKI